MFGSGNDSSPFGGGSMFDNKESSGSSIFGGSSDKKEPQGSMFDKPAGNESQGSMFDSPAGNESQGSMFDSPAGNEPKGSMFDSPAGNEPQGIMFDSPKNDSLDIGGISQTDISIDTDNKSTKMNNQDLDFNDTEKYKAAYMINESNVANLNVRGGNYGQMNMLDRMRGIQSNRLDMDLENVSLSEQYSDASLDKRAMGGMYNTTLSDIYNDKTKYAAHHGLTYDGYVDIKDDHYNVDTYASFSDKEEQGTLMGTDYGKQVDALSDRIDMTMDESKERYETHYESPMDNFEKDQRITKKESGLEYQQDLNMNQSHSSYGSIMDSIKEEKGSPFDIGSSNESSFAGGLAIGAGAAASSIDTSSPYDNNEEEKGLTPGEKYKEQRAQDNLAEKEVKKELKREEKQQQSIYEAQRREDVAQKNRETEAELDRLRQETAASEESGEESNSIFSSSSNKEDEKEGESVLDSTHNEASGLNDIEEKELTPGEKLKLEKEEKDLAEKELKAENKLAEKEEKEFLKEERREALSDAHIKKISDSNQEESTTSMYMSSEGGNKETSVMASAFGVGAASGLDIEGNHSSTKTYQEEKKKKKKGFLDLEEEEVTSNSKTNNYETMRNSTDHYQSNPMAEKEERELTPGEKLKLQKEEKDLAEKELKSEMKLEEKEYKEQLKIEKREMAAENHVKKISESNKEESTTSMYMNDSTSSLSKSQDDNKIMLSGAMAGGLSALDIGAGSLGSEAKKHKSIYELDEEEEDNIFAKKDVSQNKKINRSMYKKDEVEEETENPFSSINNMSSNQNKELYTSNPSMSGEENKELTPGEKFKLKREEQDLAEKEQREENKLQGKLEKEQLKIDRRDSLAQENIDKISQSYKTEDTSSMYFDNNSAEASKTKNDSDIILAGAGGLAALDIGAGSTGSEARKYKSVFEKEEEEEEDNIFAKKGISQNKKINKKLYQKDILKEEEEDDNPFSGGFSNNSSKELYTSNPSMNEENKELTPGEKFKLKREEQDLAEREQREGVKVQNKLDKEQMKLEKRDSLAQENIDKISSSYKTDNSSMYFDSDVNPMGDKKDSESYKTDDKSPILDSSQISSMSAGSVGYERSVKNETKKTKNSIFDLEETDDLDEALNQKSLYINGDESELTPEQKLRAKKEDQNLLEAEARDAKKKGLKIEKENLKREAREKNNNEFISGVSAELSGIAAIGSTRSKQTGFIKADDDKIVLDGEGQIGSLRSDIILPDSGGSIKSKNPLNYTEDDEEDENDLANNIMNEHKRESKILNYNEEDEEEEDEPEHFKAKAPIVGVNLKKEERDVASNLKEQGKINDMKKYQEEKDSRLPDEVIEDPNIKETSRKGLTDEDLKKIESEIKNLMERLSNDSIEKYLQKIYSKVNKSEIDKLKIKIGERIISATL